MNPIRIQNVCVVGAGSIGASFAALFAAHGIQTAVYDINPAAQSFLLSMVREAAITLSKLHGSDVSSTELESRMTSHLTFHLDLDSALSNADFVQENGPERLQPKSELLRHIDQSTKASAVIASSTSGFTCSSMQAALHFHPDRFLVGHPFNPPHLVPLVEVVGGVATSPSAIESAMSFYALVGKRPIHVKREVPGHIANRLQSALFREIMHLIDEDVVEVGDIEIAMQYGAGLRWGIMGPSTLMHLGGGPGGAEHFKEHLLEPLLTWYTSHDPVMTEELKEKWTKQTLSFVGERTYAELAKERDEAILALLRLKLGQREVSTVEHVPSEI